MTAFTIASFNVKNLIGPDQEYYEFQSYTPEEYAWKLDWMADQLLTMNADIVGFQEIFDEASLTDVIAECDAKGIEVNGFAQPGDDKRYRRRALYRNLVYRPYEPDLHLAYAPNMHNREEDGLRRPGVALLSRFPIREAVAVQDLGADAIEIAFDQLGGAPGDAGTWRLQTLSRPIQMVLIEVEGRTVCVLNAHLKSKHGEFDRAPDGTRPAENLLAYDPAARALGSLRAALRRMGEALVLRRLVLAALDQGHPVIVTGDMNDALASVSSEIVAGERPFKNYSWMLRHDAQDRSDRYSDEENIQITEDVERVRLHSAEKMFVRKSLRDMVYTSAFGGVYESIDQIFMSRHFHPDNPDRAGEMTYFSVFNDHLTDGSHPEAPYNKLASDHGQIMAHIRMTG